MMILVFPLQFSRSICQLQVEALLHLVSSLHHLFVHFLQNVCHFVVFRAKTCLLIITHEYQMMVISTRREKTTTSSDVVKNGG